MGAGSWLSQFNTPSYLSWSGFAFESVCQKHKEQIKTALNIGAGVRTGVSAWRYHPPRGSKIKGAQIDLLLDRNDGIIHLCEMKFSKNEFVIDKTYADELDNKVEIKESRMVKASSQLEGTDASTGLLVAFCMAIVKFCNWICSGASCIPVSSNKISF